MPRTLSYALAAIGFAMLLLAAHNRAADSVPTPKASTESSGAAAYGLWPIYDQSLKNAKYIDLTHTLTPSIPVWKGFGPSTFGPALGAFTGRSQHLNISALIHNQMFKS